MDEEIVNRLRGLESIIIELENNHELMRHMSYDLDRGIINLWNNFSLFWIWRALLKNQILEFCKCVKPEEKFSLSKIVNILKEKKIAFDVQRIEHEIKEVIDIYKSYDFDKVRDKFVAHQDLETTEYKTDMGQMDDLLVRIVTLFNLMSDQIGYVNRGEHNRVIESFTEIFDAVNRYGVFKAITEGAIEDQVESVNIDKLRSAAF